jgi:hypothetical protein
MIEAVLPAFTESEQYTILSGGINYYGIPRPSG